MSKKALALTLFLAACVDQVDGPEIESTERLAGNSLVPGYFEAANLNSYRLTAANIQAMASTHEGRQVLPYIVGCALPAGTSVTTTYQALGFPQSITFSGEIGLASNWQSANMTVAQRRLVSGCALARVNAVGYAVTVSIRGPSTALGVKSSELISHPQFEGVFFGNVFSNDTLEFGACRGTATSTPQGRVCAQEDTGGLTVCGYQYTGLCADACTALVDTGTHTYYQNCTVNGSTYTEALTTYVQ